MVKRRDEQLDDLFHALSDGTRRSMLRRLVKRTYTVSDLAEPYDMTLPAVSKHLGVLEDAALITRTRDGRFRTCRIDARGFTRAARWLDAYRDLWQGSFDALDEVLANATNETRRRQRG